MDYSYGYALEVTKSLRDEVRVQGAWYVSEELGVSEECVRELAPEEAKEYDEAETY